MYTTLKLTLEAKIATVTLSRAEKRNAISHQLIDEFLAALREVEHSPAQVLIVAAEGKAFCAGMDLEDLQALVTQHGGGEPSPQPAHRNPVPLTVRVSEDDDCGGERCGHCGRRGAGYVVRLYPGVDGGEVSVIPRCGLDLCRR